MEIFRDMIIRGETQQLNALMDDLEKLLPLGWVRDRAIEGRLLSLSLLAKPTYSFVHAQEDRLPAATIYFREEEPGLLVAANIVPHNKRRLHYSEYNAILEDFCERVVRPAAEKRGVQVELTTNQADLSDWLSETSVVKLRTFSTMSNQDIGCLRPDDRDRWIDFIVTSHRDGSRLTPSTLRRWLVEIEGWRPDLADQLTSEYAFGGDLLTFSKRVGA
jgi:hypothetical protein